MYMVQKRTTFTNVSHSKNNTRMHLKLSINTNTPDGSNSPSAAVASPSAAVASPSAAVASPSAAVALPTGAVASPNTTSAAGGGRKEALKNAPVIGVLNLDGDLSAGEMFVCVLCHLVLVMPIWNSLAIEVLNLDGDVSAGELMCICYIINMEVSLHRAY
jgi:hypothetical protein